MPNLADENGTTEILKVDVGLMGADNATYQLLDADNNWMEPYKYIQLSSGRQDIFFPHSFGQPIQADQCDTRWRQAHLLKLVGDPQRQQHKRC